ncbi:hypothetical protein ACFLYB_00245 [Chloroflexota bacterium]
MTVPWYEWRNIRNRLIIFGRALQGISPYRVTIEPDQSKCPSGYCSFARREIAANPDTFTVTPKDQYQLTKAILVHEAGHRRFTSPHKLSMVIHQVANILEDERIERQMCYEFAGVRWLIRKLSQTLYDESKLIDESSDSSGEVVAYFLQLRWAERIGLPIKGGLSPTNLKLWRQVEHIVYESWQAETSKVVYKNAEEIVNILRLKEYEMPQWVMDILDKFGPIDGERVENDDAEVGKMNLPNREMEEHTESDPEPFDGDVLPNDKTVGEGHAAIEPKPYIELEEKVQPLVQELIDELSFEEQPSEWVQVERGGKLSLREYVRNKDYPFLSEEENGNRITSAAIKVIVDHSTSLNHNSDGNTRMESIAEAVMILHLVCMELGIRHEVLVTPQALQIADLESGERGKALIAGLIPALCGYEDMGRAIQAYATPMVDYPEDLKLVLCLTDGACNDAELGGTTCLALRDRVEIIGILMDPDDTTQDYVAKMFGKDRLVTCRSPELPQKLGNTLRSFRDI